MEAPLIHLHPCWQISPWYSPWEQWLPGVLAGASAVCGAPFVHCGWSPFIYHGWCPLCSLWVVPLHSRWAVPPLFIVGGPPSFTMGGAPFHSSWVVPLHSPWVVPPLFVVGVLPLSVIGGAPLAPVIHLMSRGSQQWWWVYCHCLAPGSDVAASTCEQWLAVITTIPPTIHPMSSCS
jgi:hypothetical protein